MKRKSFVLCLVTLFFLPLMHFVVNAKELVGRKRLFNKRKKNDFITDYDVIVVGAGAAGIYGADFLKRYGARVCILEARDRVGGRLKSIQTNSGCFVELGGQWLAKSGQNRLERLVKKYKYQGLRNPEVGYDILVDDKGASKIVHGELPLSLAAKLDSLRFSYYLSKKMKFVQGEKIENLNDLDRIDLKKWLNKKLWTEQSRIYWNAFFEQALCCSLEKVSVLEVLLNLATIGSLDLLEKADYFYFKEGLSNIFDRMVKESNIELRFNSEVSEIHQTEHFVKIKGVFGELTSDFVLVTAPPQICSKFLFDPPLKSSSAQILKDPILGHVVKVAAVFDKPWWRDGGFSGLIQSSVGPFDFIIDSSFEESKNGILVGLAQGRSAQRLNELSENEIKKLFVKQICLAFKSFHHPSEFYCVNWNKEIYSLGGFSSRRKVGEWTLYGQTFSSPHGRIYFAGTESAWEWRGYIEGALESGERQARGIINRLKQKS